MLHRTRRVQAQDGNSEDKLSLGAKCLHVLIAQLTEEGVPQEDLQPLVELEAVLQKLREPQGNDIAQRRKGRPPREALLARASAMIDLLIKAGNDESKAAQP